MKFDEIFDPVYAGTPDDDSVTKAKEQLAALIIEERKEAYKAGLSVASVDYEVRIGAEGSDLVRLNTNVSTDVANPPKSAQSTIDSEVDKLLTRFDIDMGAASAINNGRGDHELIMQARTEAKAKITNLIAQEANKAVVAELERKMTLHVDLMSSKDFKAGFSAALDQIDAANLKRIAQLTADKESNNG